jgi:hypothetical protein
MFLGWTHHLASDLGVPRVVFWTSGAHAVSIFNALWRDLPRIDDPDDEDSVLSLPNLPNSPKYPCWQITSLYRLFKEGDPDWEFFRNGMLANSQSWGAVLNSFTELERVYIEHIKKKMGHDRVWSVGPLLLDGNDLLGPNNRGGSSSVSAHEVMGWLDSKADDSVVYVCFGSRWTLTSEQLGALAAALECSGVHFIWCLKDSDLENSAISDGFKNRVVGKGFLIKGWAPQVAILGHRAVGAFVTHCGWNSVLEALAAGVLMLTWPVAADQFTNANLLVDQIGLAVRFCECGSRTVPDSGKLSRLLAESVGGTRPERQRVMEVRNAATEAIKGGSSSRDMEALVNKLCGLNSSSC